jgi:hypothetical protein
VVAGDGSPGLEVLDDGSEVGLVACPEEAPQAHALEAVMAAYAHPGPALWGLQKLSLRAHVGQLADNRRLSSSGMIEYGNLEADGGTVSLFEGVCRQSCH